MLDILAVERASLASKLNIRPGSKLVSVNLCPVNDILDYQYLTAASNLKLLIMRRNGSLIAYDIEKPEYEPLGLTLAEGLKVGRCKNACMFCFIDQLPPGLRESLYFKDDDWRHSLMMGNYVTLTNVTDMEFERILAMRASPLNISVHTTNEKLRVHMMKNKRAANIYDKLCRLADANISFNSQIVCCPGINSGEELERTLLDLFALRPNAMSVSVVPVGITKFRKGLSDEIKPFTKQTAIETIELVSGLSRRFKARKGTSFAFLSDEFYMLAQMELPDYSHYEDFPQLENGVGLLRQFEYEFIQALSEKTKTDTSFDAAGGVLAAPFFAQLYRRLREYGIDYTLHAVENEFFGPHITVGGLLTGGDLVRALKGKIKSDRLLIPHQMLREMSDVFLDDMNLGTLERELDVRVVPVYGGGEAWVEQIFNNSED